MTYGLEGQNSMEMIAPLCGEISKMVSSVLKLWILIFLSAEPVAIR